jgi:hypothetical protein
MSRILLLGLILALAGCAQQSKKDFTAYNLANPRSILVVPITNDSLDVDAPNYMLSTLAFPLAEKGYYVFPINTTKMILEREGLYEGEQVRNAPASQLAGLFGADAILYVHIKRWDAQYALISTTVTVEFDYRMVDRQGVEIWNTTQSMNYSPQNQSTGNPIADLIVAGVTAAVARAAPNYMPLAQQANQVALVTGRDAIPQGPYNKP